MPRRYRIGHPPRIGDVGESEVHPRHDGVVCQQSLGVGCWTGNPAQGNTTSAEQEGVTDASVWSARAGELPGASRSIVEAILGERRTEATTFSEFLDLCAGPAPRGRRFLFGGVAGRSLDIGGILGRRARLRWRVGHRGVEPFSR